MKTRDTTRIILGEVVYKDNLYMNYLEVYVKFNHSKLCNLKLWIFLSPFIERKLEHRHFSDFPSLTDTGGELESGGTTPELMYMTWTKKEHPLQVVVTKR